MFVFRRTFVALSLSTCALGAASLLAPGLALAAGPWSGNGPPGGRVVALAVSGDPTAPVIAALDGAGLWRSDDGGAQWQDVTAGLPASAQVTALAYSPLEPSRLVAGLADGAVFRSDDGAIAFEELAGSIDSATVIVFDPVSPDRFFVATENAGVNRTDDGGVTFQGLPGILPLDPFVHSFAVDPFDPDRLYFGTQWGVVVSTDGGLTLTGDQGGSLDAIAILIDPLDPLVVLCAGEDGVFRSEDAGQTWAKSDTGIVAPEVQSMIRHPEAGLLFASTRTSGVWMSADGAATWIAVSDGLRERNILRIAPAPSGPGLLSGGARGGIFGAADAQTWAPKSDGLSSSFVSRVVASDGQWLAPAAGTGVHVSSDNGLHWAPSSAGLPWDEVTALAASKSDPLVRYVGTANSGVQRSADGGATWVPASGAPPSRIDVLAVHPEDANHLFASSNDTIWETAGAGDPWTALGTAFPGQVTGITFVGSPPRLYVLSDGAGLFTLDAAGTAIVPAPAIASDYGKFVLSMTEDTQSGVLYAGLHGEGVVRSDDGGESWTVCDADGLTDFWIYAVAAHPSAPDVLYAGTFDAGVFRSDDGGATFQPLSDGLGAGLVTSLEFTSNDVLIASTRGSGVFWIDQSVGPGPSTTSSSSSSSSAASSSNSTSSGGGAGAGGGGGSGGDSGGGASGSTPAGGCACVLGRQEPEQDGRAGALSLAIVALGALARARKRR